MGSKRSGGIEPQSVGQLRAGKVVASVEGHHGATAKNSGAEMEHQPGRAWASYPASMCFRSFICRLGVLGGLTSIAESAQHGVPQ